MVPFPKDYIEKDSGKSLPPGFWIGIVLVFILIYLTNQCKGGVVP